MKFATWIFFFQHLGFLKMSHFVAKEKVSEGKLILLQVQPLYKNVKRNSVLQTGKPAIYMPSVLKKSLSLL